MKSFWLIVVGVCGLAAAYFAFKSDFDKVFIAATLGAVAWFLSYREIIKSRLDDDEEEP